MCAHVYHEAAWVLDALGQRRAALKTLVHAPEVTEKRKVYALVTQTLKYRAVLQDVLAAAGWAATPEGRRTRPSLALVLAHDLLVSGRGVQCGGPLKTALAPHRARLRAELSRILVRRHARAVDELLPPELRDPAWIPRWVRVNALRARSRQDVLDRLARDGWRTVDPAVTPLDALTGAGGQWARADDLLPELLALPPAADLHEHPWYLDGTLVLQDKASCLPAAALGVSPATRHAIDACAAPGNKTSHLAALMGNRGRISAFDTDARRLALLRTLTARAGATNIVATHKSFLDVDPRDATYVDVTHILLDPSCSGSGIVARLDELVDGGGDEHDDAADSAEDRLTALAAFQTAALKHALAFPAVQRVVYSTCSVHQRENEDVVRAVLESPEGAGFGLVRVFPEWPRRGLPVFAGAECCLRTVPREDHVIGFFVALFERRDGNGGLLAGKRAADDPGHAPAKKRHRAGKKNKRKNKHPDVNNASSL